MRIRRVLWSQVVLDAFRLVYPCLLSKQQAISQELAGLNLRILQKREFLCGLMRLAGKEQSQRQDENCDR